MKYKNPIHKPDTVIVQRWEYASLIRQSERLRIIERMTKDIPSYQWDGMMKIVFEKEGE